MSTACLPVSPESTRVKSRDGPLNAARYRNYHPTLGRWIERDPAGYVAGANLYAYCSGGPAGAVDPTGLSPFGGINRVPVAPALEPSAPLGGITPEPTPHEPILPVQPFTWPPECNDLAGWQWRFEYRRALEEFHDRQMGAFIRNVDDLGGRLITSYFDSVAVSLYGTAWLINWGVLKIREIPPNVVPNWPPIKIPEIVAKFLNGLLNIDQAVEDSWNNMESFERHFRGTWRRPWSQAETPQLPQPLPLAPPSGTEPPIPAPLPITPPTCESEEMLL